SLQAFVDAGTIGAVVNFAMTVRAYRSHETRIVWPAISQPSNVVRLQIRDTADRDERCRTRACFAVAIRAREDIGANVAASLIDGALSNGSICLRGRRHCFDGASTERL